MNTEKYAPKTLLINAVGALLVIIALAFGAGLGHLINPEAPAQATTPTETPCSAFCADKVGSGGNVPSPISGSVSVGNSN